jgi:hypothetical protein
VTKSHHKRNVKFGIEVPRNWADCVQYNKDNNNIFWEDTVKKDMMNVRIAFNIFIGDEAIPPTYQEITCHMIFDVKLEYFRRKARFVAGGHTMDTPHIMMYASVVFPESMRVASPLADLNDVDVKMVDIENAYPKHLSLRKFGQCSVLSLELMLGRKRSFCEHSMA